jgi:diadenosine tetraphosphate (Ap4A) HIT family hydrolase
MTSPFLQVPVKDWIDYNEHAFAIWDGYPVNPGHVLVVPFRDARDWFETLPHEQAAIMDLVGRVKTMLDEKYKPDGYNVGFNVGEAGGQTVFHLHVHVIPRYSGDMGDPRGGVRHVIPERGNYRKNQPR